MLITSEGLSQTARGPSLDGRVRTVLTQVDNQLSELTGLLMGPTELNRRDLLQKVEWCSTLLNLLLEKP